MRWFLSCFSPFCPGQELEEVVWPQSSKVLLGLLQLRTQLRTRLQGTMKPVSSRNSL